MIVNGVASPWRPVQPEAAPDRFSAVVPLDHYFILPTSGVNFPNKDNVEAWQTMSLVPQNSIVGCVYLRAQPLSRLAWIR